MPKASEVISKGNTIEIEGNVYRVDDFQHVKPGKGAAFIRTKLKNVKDGGVVEKTFRPEENIDRAIIDKSTKTYLYHDDDFYYFMDSESFEQIELPVGMIVEEMKFVKENEEVKMLSHNGVVFSVEPPLFVELEITETEPGIKGNTAQNTLKPAVVETGAQVSVPLFVGIGDKIKIDTRTGEYLSRV